jgi:hypothetical protein
MMVDQIAKGVADATYTQGVDTQVGKPLDLTPSKEAEPVVGSPDSAYASIARVAETVVTPQGLDSPVMTGSKNSVVVPRPSELSTKALQAGSLPVQNKRTLSCPPASRSGLSGPWNLEWIRDHNLGDAGVIFSAKKRPKSGREAGGENHKKVAKGIPKSKAGVSYATHFIALKGLHVSQSMIDGRCCKSCRRMQGNVGIRG